MRITGLFSLSVECLNAPADLSESLRGVYKGSPTRHGFTTGPKCTGLGAFLTRFGFTAARVSVFCLSSFFAL